MVYVIYENIYYVKCYLYLIDLYTLYSIKIVHVWYVWKCKGPMNVMVKFISFWKLSIKVYSKLPNIFPMCFGSLNGNQGPECIGVLTSIKGSMGVNPGSLAYSCSRRLILVLTRLPPSGNDTLLDLRLILWYIIFMGQRVCKYFALYLFK